MYNERDSLTPRHKITLDRVDNHSVNQIHTATFINNHIVKHTRCILDSSCDIIVTKLD